MPNPRKPNIHAINAEKSLLWAQEYLHSGDVAAALRQLEQAVGLFAIAKDKDGVKRAEARLKRVRECAGLDIQTEG